MRAIHSKQKTQTHETSLDTPASHGILRRCTCTRHTLSLGMLLLKESMTHQQKPQGILCNSIIVSFFMSESALLPSEYL